jgi:hypothetical protein
MPKTWLCSNDPIIAVAFSPGYLRYFLAMVPLDAWNLFGGDIAQHTDCRLPQNTALLTYSSGRLKLVEIESIKPFLSAAGPE